MKKDIQLQELIKDIREVIADVWTLNITSFYI